MQPREEEEGESSPLVRCYGWRSLLLISGVSQDPAEVLLVQNDTPELVKTEGSVQGC